VAAALVVALVAASLLIDEPLRRYVEGRVNESLDGYTVRIGRLDFHPLGFSVDFEDLVVTQDAHPDPPVAHIPRWAASVHWRALLRGRLVGNVSVERPVLHVDLAHLRREAEDPVPVERRGWQEAVRAMYPLEINLFTVADGEVTYVDAGPEARPLRLSAVQVRAENIRNVASRDRVYPSPFRLEAAVFERGALVVDGDADFLAAPHPGVLAQIRLDGLELDYFRPILARQGLQVRGGVLSAEGNAEYAPSIRAVHVEQATVQGVAVDYVRTPARQGQAAAAARTAVRAAEQASNRPDLQFRVGRLRVSDSSVGFVNRSTRPEYRVFLSDATLDVRNLSNHFVEGPAQVRLTGRFMGSGATTATGTFRSDVDGPDFDLDVRIEGTDARTMNDLLRAHGKFDVVRGTFAFYSELRAHDRRIDGYVKPLFADLDVYDPGQDRDKGFFRKLYERVVGGVAKMLENRPRDEVATVAEVEGPLQDPRASTLQIVLRLVQNAFFEAILPGFERQVARRR
jgi:hypothetical protein